MRWVKMFHDRACERCGARIARFVGLMKNTPRVSEVTFCPMCCPEVKKAVAMSDRRTRTRRRRRNLLGVS